MSGYDAKFNPPLRDKYKCPICDKKFKKLIKL